MSIIYSIELKCIHIYRQRIYEEKKVKTPIKRSETKRDSARGTWRQDTIENNKSVIKRKRAERAERHIHHIVWYTEYIIANGYTSLNLQRVQKM